MRKLDDLSVFSKPRIWRSINAKSDRIFDSGYLPDAEVSAGWSSSFSQLFFCCYFSVSTLTRTFCQRRDSQKFLSLEYIEFGEFYIRDGTTGYVAEAGDLCILHPGQKHDLLYLQGEPCRKSGMIFRGQKLLDIISFFQLEQTSVVRIIDRERFQNLCSELKATIGNIGFAKAHEHNAALSFELFHMIADERRSCDIPMEIRAVLDYMDSHCSDPLCMAELAATARMSLPTLNARFRRIFHTTPYRYLIQLRMRRAANLLLMNRYSVKEIAAMCGYQTPLHFSAEFHRCFGISPREYRKRGAV